MYKRLVKKLILNFGRFSVLVMKVYLSVEILQHENCEITREKTLDD